MMLRITFYKSFFFLPEKILRVSSVFLLPLRQHLGGKNNAHIVFFH